MKLKDYRIAIVVLYFSCLNEPEHCKFLIALIQGKDPNWAKAAKLEGISIVNGELRKAGK